MKESKSVFVTALFSFFSYFSFVIVGLTSNDMLFTLLIPSIFGVIFYLVEKDRSLEIPFYYMLLNLGWVIVSLPMLGVIFYPDVIFPLGFFYLITSPLLFSLPLIIRIPRFSIGYLSYLALVILKNTVEWKFLNMLNLTFYLITLSGIVFNLFLVINSVSIGRRDKKNVE